MYHYPTECLPYTFKDPSEQKYPIHQSRLPEEPFLSDGLSSDGKHEGFHLIVTGWGRHEAGLYQLHLRPKCLISRLNDSLTLKLVNVTMMMIVELPILECDYQIPTVKPQAAFLVSLPLSLQSSSFTPSSPVCLHSWLLFPWLINSPFW